MSTYQNGENLLKERFDSQRLICSDESLPRMEDNNRQTETPLQKFKNSIFFLFVLLSQVNLFGKKRSAWEETCLQFSGMAAANSTVTKSGKTAKNMTTLTAVN